MAKRASSKKAAAVDVVDLSAQRVAWQEGKWHIVYAGQWSSRLACHATLRTGTEIEIGVGDTVRADCCHACMLRRSAD